MAAILERGSGIALWRQVETRLALELRRRPEGADPKLPSEAELARRFGVNRHTVRQALRALAEQGLVRSEQGRGTFAQVGYALGRRVRFGASLQAQDRTPGREPLAIEETTDPAIAARLGLAPGAPLVHQRTLGTADGVPLTVAGLYLSSERFPGALRDLPGFASITRFWRSRGIVDYRRRRTRITARLPEADEAELLRQPRTSPVLVTEALDVDPEDAPLSFAITVWSAARVHLTVEA
jgi:GntR family transcriptional regulator, phosphonate transport system regulatory protein